MRRTIYLGPTLTALSNESGEGQFSGRVEQIVTRYTALMDHTNEESCPKLAELLTARFLEHEARMRPVTPDLIADLPKLIKKYFAESKDTTPEEVTEAVKGLRRLGFAGTVALVEHLGF